MEADKEKTVVRVTLTGSAVNLLLTAYKFAAGFLGHSSAMIADAVHSLSDLVTDFIVIAFVHIAGKPSDGDHDYGHAKYETIATLIVAVILCCVGIGMAVGGIGTIISAIKGETMPEPTWVALSAAIISIIAKELLYRYTVRCGKAIDSPALAANAWHHRSDALTSLAALAGIGGAMLLGPSWRVLDPLAAVIVSGFIVKAAFDIGRPAFNDLMDKSLSEADKKRIEEIVSTTPGVTSFHRLRTRRIGSDIAVTIHLKMPGNISLFRAHSIASEAEKRLRDAFGANSYISIHMEPEKKNN